MVKKLTPRVALLATLVLAAACELGTTPIPRSDPLLVVHSVLNPSTGSQVVLVEESLTGSQTVVDSGPYNPINPISTGNGVPVGGAVVRLTGPDGFTATGNEIRTSGGNPTGMYMIDVSKNPDPVTGAFLRPGERYSLSVQARGMTVTGSTLIPRARPYMGAIPVASFNRDHDSVTFAPHDVAEGRAFWLRVDAPISPFSLFSFDPDFAVSGNTRNLFTDELVRLFFPGFQQTVTLAIGDTNVYDYYRSGSDPFSGAGLINRLEGGLGLFGSVVVLERRTLDVTQDPSGDPIEATYTLRAGGTAESPRTMTLYLEAKGPTPESGDRLSGNYLRNGVALASAVFGFRTGSNVELQILAAHSTATVASVFRASVRGDSLRGNFSSGVGAVYVKVGK